MRQFKDLGIAPPVEGFTGDKIKMSKILNKPIIVHKYRIVKSKFDKGNGDRLDLQIELNGSRHVVFTSSVVLMEMIRKVPPDSFPFETSIEEKDERFEFT